MTLNSPIRSMNSRVPSRGSTTHSRASASRAGAGASSLRIGSPARCRPRTSRIASWLARSAAVTGPRPVGSSTARSSRSYSSSAANPPARAALAATARSAPACPAVFDSESWMRWIGSMGRSGSALAPYATAGPLDAPQLEGELRGVGSVGERLFLIDGAFVVELHEALIERLHPVLNPALGDQLGDLGRPVAAVEEVADRLRVDHDLAGRDPRLAIGGADEPQRHYPLQVLGQQRADLLSSLRREERHDTLDRLRGVGRMQRREDEVAGIGRLERDVHRFGIADLPHHQDIRILPEHVPEAGGVVRGVHPHLALRDERLVVA